MINFYTNNKFFEEALQKVSQELENFFNSNKDYYKNNPDMDFKVRVGYGYSKFYLTRVEGSYEMSLQALIHFILYEKRFFKKLLSKETYRKLAPFMRKIPDSLYDFSNNKDEYEMVNLIEYLLICQMRCFFKINNLDDSDFIYGEYELEPQFDYISKCSIFDNRILRKEFYNDFDSYLKNNDLDEREQKKLFLIFQNIYDIYDLLRLSSAFAQKNFEKLSKKLIYYAIKRVEKNSEYTAIAIFIKDNYLFGNEVWAKKVLALKS